MEIQNSEIKYSEIELDIEISEENDQIIEDSLQRTEQWHEDRKGNWTASQFKNVMASDNAGGKMDWFNKEKVFRFSEGSIKYIFANAMERKTGRYITSDSTKEMKYGTKIESLIFRRFSEYLRNKGLKLEQVGFKIFDDFPTAGVSSDAIVKTLGDQIVASAEFKACSSWSTLFERTYELMDEKGKDFWQTQGQMEAWNVDSNYYVVISPPKDINVYLYSDNIESMYEHWVNETEMTVQIVKKSPIHCKALNKRIRICESVVERFLSEDNSELTLKEILYEEIDWFKKYWEKNGDSDELKEHVSKFEAAVAEVATQADFEQMFPVEHPKEEQPKTEPNIPKSNEINWDESPF